MGVIVSVRAPAGAVRTAGASVGSICGVDGIVLVGAVVGGSVPVGKTPLGVGVLENEQAMKSAASRLVTTINRSRLVFFI
jgi:hypothetical protein